MAAVARFHLLHPSPVIKPTFILPKFPYTSPFRTADGSRLRKISTATLLRCNAESSSSPRPESSQSIVGDLLDYLNESWTQFHATGLWI